MRLHLTLEPTTFEFQGEGLNHHWPLLTRRRTCHSNSFDVRAKPASNWLNYIVITELPNVFHSNGIARLYCTIPCTCRSNLDSISPFRTRRWLVDNGAACSRFHFHPCFARVIAFWRRVDIEENESSPGFHGVERPRSTHATPTTVWKQGWPSSVSLASSPMSSLRPEVLWRLWGAARFATLVPRPPDESDSKARIFRGLPPTTISSLLLPCPRGQTFAFKGRLIRRWTSRLSNFPVPMSY